MEKLELNQNVNAFLDTLAVSELGQELLDVSDDGYNVIVGSTARKPVLFNSYADHPRKSVILTIKGKPGTEPKLIRSTAAGRYQILSRYFDAYRHQLRLTDFGPYSQDMIAIQLIRECRAVDLILKGNIAAALVACKSRWASLPGAGYGQHEHDLEHLCDVFYRKGGVKLY